MQQTLRAAPLHAGLWRYWLGYFWNCIHCMQNSLSKKKLQRHIGLGYMIFSALVYRIFADFDFSLGYGAKKRSCDAGIHAIGTQVGVCCWGMQ
jgi:hypothetical protein